MRSRTTSRIGLDLGDQLLPALAEQSASGLAFVGTSSLNSMWDWIEQPIVLENCLGAKPSSCPRVEKTPVAELPPNVVLMLAA